MKDGDAPEAQARLDGAPIAGPVGDVRARVSVLLGAADRATISKRMLGPAELSGSTISKRCQCYS